MRSRLLVIAVGLLTFQCTVNRNVEGNQFASPSVEIVGTYHYVPDSVSNPNRNYREKLRLDSDSTFLYEVRQGGLINYSTTGTWGFCNDHVVLSTDASYPRATVEKATCITSSEVRVSEYGGAPINFVITGKLPNGLDTTLFSSTVGLMKLANLDIEDAFVLSPSGITSPVFDIKKSECSKVEVSLPNRRTFDHEKWRLLDGKIMPLNSRGEVHDYYLYPAQ